MTANETTATNDGRLPKGERRTYLKLSSILMSLVALIRTDEPRSLSLWQKYMYMQNEMFRKSITHSMEMKWQKLNLRTVKAFRVWFSHISQWDWRTLVVDYRHLIDEWPNHPWICSDALRATWCSAYFQRHSPTKNVSNLQSLKEHKRRLQLSVLCTDVRI